MMTEVSLRTRMTLAGICTGKIHRLVHVKAHMNAVVLSPGVCDSFLLFFFSALTQFFQIFPEYQSNEFYATGEVRCPQPRFY